MRFSLSMTNPHALLGIGVGLACFLWLLGGLVFFGLPSYYRQTPGRVPTFYLSLFRRRIVLVCPSPLSLQPVPVLISNLAVVLLHGVHLELLALGSVRSQLAIPLVQ